MSKKHVQHKVTYCCDQGLSFFTAELNEAVEHGFKAGILSERERIIKLLLKENWDDPEIATPYVRHAIELIEQ